MNRPSEKVLETLSSWLPGRLDAAALAWVEESQKFIRSNDRKRLFLAFGMAPRKVGKADLQLTSAELAAAKTVRPGWNPSGWSVDQAVRTVFILSLPEQEAASLVSTLDQLFGTGEVGELVALYQMLPLLPYQSAHVLRAAEGIRTNIKAVFGAVAHQNPYPSEQFNEDQWNQMVLKCQFIGVPMSPIIGLDERANSRLAGMVTNFIHERWAASRTVAPDMWRCVGRFATQQGLGDLEKVLTTGSPIDRQAAALALSECPLPQAGTILARTPELLQQIKSGAITWTTIDESSRSSE